MPLVCRRSPSCDLRSFSLHRRDLGVVVELVLRDGVVVATPPPRHTALSTSPLNGASRRRLILPSATPPRWSTGLRLNHAAFCGLSVASHRLITHRPRDAARPLLAVLLHPGRRLLSPHPRGECQPAACRPAIATKRPWRGGVAMALGDWLPRVCGTSAGASPWHPAPLLSSSSVSRRPPMWPYAPPRLVGCTTCNRMWSGVAVRSWCFVLCPDLPLKSPLP